MGEEYSIDELAIYYARKYSDSTPSDIKRHLLIRHGADAMLSRQAARRCLGTYPKPFNPRKKTAD